VLDFVLWPSVIAVVPLVLGLLWKIISALGDLIGTVGGQMGRLRQQHLDSRHDQKSALGAARAMETVFLNSAAARLDAPRRRSSRRGRTWTVHENSDEAARQQLEDDGCPIHGGPWWISEDLAAGSESRESPRAAKEPCGPGAWGSR
jgi:hypothetical protein